MKTPKVGEKVRLVSFSDISEKDDFSMLDGLEMNHVYEVERLGGNGFIQLEGQQGYFHSTNKFELYVQDDPPINIQWDGVCFIIDDSIRIDPVVLREILACYEFDENGMATDIKTDEPL